MKKQLFLFFLMFVIGATLSAQDQEITRSGHLWLFSHAPIEDIEAHSYQAVVILMPSTGGIAIEVPIMSFEFRKAIMQVHFNENYMESSKYPSAKFIGTITNLQDVNFLRDGIYAAFVEGKLTLHNVTRDIKADGTIEMKNGQIAVKSKFEVDPKDYNIMVERRFSRNIAPYIDVNVDFLLSVSSSQAMVQP
jgi:uncharacterized protein YhdP